MIFLTSKQRKRCFFRLYPNNSYTQSYLTFDDGPNMLCTSDVLDCLDTFNDKGTFFCISDFAKKNKELVRDIKLRGHSIGNHSLDHRYRYFFRSRTILKEWVRKSEEQLEDIIGSSTVGFRSPAGVVTPVLLQVLDELNIPLIHWNIRFYDTSFMWSKSRADRAIKNIKNGSIILLHDSHSGNRKTIFMDTLAYFIRSLQEKEILLKAITRDDIDESRIFISK